MTIPLRNMVSLYLTFASIAIAGLGIYLLLRRKGALVFPFAMFLVTTAIYIFGYSMEILHDDLPGILFWIRIEYLGIATYPVFYFLSAFVFSGYGGKIHRSMLLPILLMPFVIIVVVWTNHLHFLHYASVSLETSGPFPVLSFDRGPWYWVVTIYQNLNILAGVLLFSLKVFRSSGDFRKQASIVLFASLIPWFGYFFYMARLVPWNLDVTPFFLSFSAVMFYIGVFKYRFVELVPMAREKLFEAMEDGILVLDSAERITDFNRRVKDMFPRVNLHSLGATIREVFHDLPDILISAHSKSTTSYRFQHYGPEGRRYFESRRFSIRSKDETEVGSMLMIRDTTEQTILTSRFRELSIIDEFTGFYNKQFFDELAVHEIERCSKNGRRISMILMEFIISPEENKTRNNPLKREILKLAAEQCRNIFRKSDIIGRTDETEFSVLLPETSMRAAAILADRFRSAASTLLKADLHMGVSGNLENYLDLSTAVRRGLLGAREKGPNSLELYP